MAKRHGHIRSSNEFRTGTLCKRCQLAGFRARVLVELCDHLDCLLLVVVELFLRLLHRAPGRSLVLRRRRSALALVALSLLQKVAGRIDLVLPEVALFRLRAVDDRRNLVLARVAVGVC